MNVYCVADRISMEIFMPCSKPYTMGLAVLLFLSTLACVDPSPSSNPMPRPDQSPDLSFDMMDIPGDMRVDQSADMPVDQSVDMSIDMPADQAGDMQMSTGEAIDSPEKTWTWVTFPDSTCGNGQPTGIGVSRSTTSKDVLIFMQGGGACWDVNTCFVLKSAANLESGYTQTHFDNASIKNASLFDRDSADNPFKDASYVYIPYCTGDLHNGDRVKRYMAVGQTRDIHHRGAHNVHTFLKRLAPTFEGQRNVFLTGASAGGYGAQFNYERFVRAMPQAEVHLMADSSPLVQPYDGRFGAMRAAWDFQADASCVDCETRLSAWISHLITTYPNRRFGLLAYEEDEVIRLYFGYPIDPTPFKNRLNLLIADHYNVDHANVFTRPGSAHVMFGAPHNIKNGDVTLLDWITWWKEGDPRWANLR